MKSCVFEEIEILYGVQGPGGACHGGYDITGHKKAEIPNLSYF